MSTTLKALSAFEHGPPFPKLRPFAIHFAGVPLAVLSRCSVCHQPLPRADDVALQSSTAKPLMPWASAKRPTGVSPSSDEQNLNQVAESRFDVAVVEQFHDVFREASFNSTQPRPPAERPLADPPLASGGF